MTQEKNNRDPEEICDVEIILRGVAIDENRRRYTTGGIRIVPGKKDEILPASYFDDTNLHALLEKDAGGELA